MRSTRGIALKRVPVGACRDLRHQSEIGQRLEACARLLANGLVQRAKRVQGVYERVEMFAAAEEAVLLRVVVYLRVLVCEVRVVECEVVDHVADLAREVDEGLARGVGREEVVEEDGSDEVFLIFDLGCARLAFRESLSRGFFESLAIVIF